MKKVLKVTLLCIISCLFLSACHKNDTSSPTTDTVSISSKPVTPSDSVLEEVITKEQVMQIFMNDENNSDCIITDCAVAVDMAYGLTGVVQYTDNNGYACNLAFVKDTSSHPLGLDSNNLLVIANDSVLTYQGNGIVTLSLKDQEKDVIYDYTVEYSCNSTSINFIVSASARK